MRYLCLDRLDGAGLRQARGNRNKGAFLSRPKTRITLNGGTLGLGFVLVSRPISQYAIIAAMVGSSNTILFNSDRRRRSPAR